MYKTIITSPFLKHGGVAQFIKSLSTYFGEEIVIFKRAKREKAKFHTFFLPIIDVFRFIFFLLNVKPKKLIVNSSLSIVGILRDGFFIFYSKKLGIKTILFIHGFNEKALTNEQLIKKGYFRADKIFVLSSDFKKKLIDLGYVNPIIVTYNPINQKLISNPIKKVNRLKDNNSIKILMMSRIEESKGIFIGLKAMKNLQIYNIEMHIAGIGSELEKAKTYVVENRLRNVFFHGFVSGEKKVQLFKNSDILLFPTFHNEGLPINVLESLAMGLYVITRPVAGIKDLKNNYHLSLVNSKESIEFENIIHRLLESGFPEKAIIENQLKAKEDFSPKRIFEKVVISS